MPQHTHLGSEGLGRVPVTLLCLTQSATTKANQLNMIHQKVSALTVKSKAYIKGQSNTKHQIIHKVSSYLPLSPLLEYAACMRKGLTVDTEPPPHTFCSLTVSQVVKP